MVRAVLSLFLLVTKRLYGKEWEWSIVQIKTCRKKQHVRIDDRKEMSDLICGKAAVGGNYNSTRDSITPPKNVYHTPDFVKNPNLHSDSPLLYYYIGGRKKADYRDTNLQHFPRKKIK